MLASRTVLQMDYVEAKEFFLKTESYFTGKLPEYYDLSMVLSRAIVNLQGSSLADFSVSRRSNNSINTIENVNYTLFVNKDGSYSWRPIQLIHPMVYVDLVNYITTNDNWEKIKRRFIDFQSNPQIVCVSLPRKSLSKNKDLAETILNWWRELEQAQIKYSLNYDCCIHTDIADCYSSIYTHTIAWVYMGREEAKRNKKTGIGNDLDRKIQDSQYGQTNGIPQGSVLMDFIAELVLGFADLLLDELMSSEFSHISKYQILRYRDDYRIFTKTKEEAETIIKALSDTLATLNLKLNASKTFFTDDIIANGIKEDKLYWEKIYTSFTMKNKSGINYNLPLQKHLLQIKVLSDKFKNSGSLLKALTEVYKNRIILLKREPNDINQLISIIVSIIKNNPRTIEIGVIILSKLLTFVSSDNIESITDDILTKFNKIPNIDTVEIWMQRLTIVNTREKVYKAPLCRKVIGDEINIWESRWLKNGFEESGFINEEIINELVLSISFESFEIFTDAYISSTD